jgi:hypothetical protein
MRKRILTISIIAAVVFALAGDSVCLAECATDIWICQETGTNSPDTQGTPEDPYKSITYALARCDFLGCPEPWCVHIGPGVYDANSTKPAPEREIFPIELRQAMVFEGANCDDPNDPNIDPNTRIIDGQHLALGLAPLLYGDSRTGLVIRNLTFRNMDHSQGNGGAIELEQCAGKIENCIIENCSAQNGGGLYLSPRTDPAVPFDFTSCSFTGNSSSGYGGGFYVSASLTGTINDCTFSGNSLGSWSYGGGFCVWGSLTGSINGCTFGGNSGGSYSRGGGFYVNGTLTGNINDSSFSDNSCYYSGGGFYVNTLNGNVTDCSFAGNSADSGGGCLVSTLTGDITGCSFTGNSAGDGGGCYVNTLNGNISACGFTENSASSGGGVYIHGRLTGDISRCEFDNGVSFAASSAVYLNDRFDGVMESCRFFDFLGNGVRLLSSDATTAKIRSCLFAASVALGEVSGWAIDTKQKTIISNNTIVGPGLGAVPSQPSAIYIGFNTQAENGEIKNNIIVDTQCGIHVDAAVDMPIKYNCFNNINEIVCQGESCLGYDCWWIEWILSNFRYNYCETDPCFVPGDPIYHVQESSPCVDTADPNYVIDVGETDIDGQPRIINCQLDRGADEYAIGDYNDVCWDPNECAGQPCGDATCDGQVNLADLFALKADFGECAPWTPPECCADFTQDGCINLGDLFALKAGFGSGPHSPSTGNQSCPP